VVPPDTRFLSIPVGFFALSARRPHDLDSLVDVISAITRETARDTESITSYLASASMKINSELFCRGSVTLSPFPIISRAVTFRSALLRS